MFPWWTIILFDVIFVGGGCWFVQWAAGRGVRLAEKEDSAPSGRHRK